jgi:hypothetical protein
MVKFRTYRRYAAVGLAAIAALAVTGCTGKDATPTSTPTTKTRPASPTPSVDPSVTAATQAAVTVYEGYIQSWAAASQAADPDNPDLARYVADPLLSLTRHNLQKLKDSGEVQVGAQTATVLRTEADLNSAQPSIKVHACLDYSALRLVYKSNHSPVPNSAITTARLSTIATVWLYQNGQWLVNKIDDGSDPC